MNKIGLIFVTVSSEAQAHLIANSLVESRLAACVNIIAGVTSIYRWENKLTKDLEFLLLIKSTERNYPELEKKIKELHSYDNPEIIFTPITTGSKKYLDWVIAESEKS